MLKRLEWTSKPSAGAGPNLLIKVDEISDIYITFSLTEFPGKRKFVCVSLGEKIRNQGPVLTQEGRLTEIFPAWT